VYNFIIQNFIDCLNRTECFTGRHEAARVAEKIGRKEFEATLWFKVARGLWLGLAKKKRGGTSAYT
jgi:hypothetical protein